MKTGTGSWWLDTRRAPRNWPMIAVRRTLNVRKRIMPLGRYWHVYPATRECN